MIGNLTADQQTLYNKYLAATNASGGAGNIDDTTLVWGDDGSLTATEDDGDVFVFSADGTLISKTEGNKKNETNAGNLNITSKDKEGVIAELKAKYAAESTGSDLYTIDNKQLQSFQQAMNDGLISSLSKAGFSRSDIIGIIAEVFPSIGIAQTDNGGYTLPYGHDDESKKLYDEFKAQISKVGDTSPEIEALKTSIAGLENKIAYNNNQLSSIADKVETLKKEIQEIIEQAIDESEEIAEEQKDEAKRIVSEELDNYANSKGSMSYEDFKTKLAGRLDSLDASGQSKLSSVTMKLLNAESKMALLNGYLTTMNTLQNTNKEIQNQIGTKTQQMQVLQEELAKNQTEDDDCCQRTDPIGFSANGMKYDFFVDKDNDSLLSNEQEFLGAEDGWEEMTALDTNNDGKVDKNELAESDIKVVITDKDGNQTIKNAANIFSENDSINLNSYTELNQDIGNGNTLLGTFGLTFGGTNIDKGYNTLDSLDWLDNNYEFSDKDKGIGRFAQSETIVQEDKTNFFSQMIEQFKEDYKNLESQLTAAWNSINISRDEVLGGIADAMQTEGETKAAELEAELAEYQKKQEENTAK